MIDIIGEEETWYDQGFRYAIHGLDENEIDAVSKYLHRQHGMMHEDGDSGWYILTSSNYRFNPIILFSTDVDCTWLHLMVN